ncbi:hypothetical protein ACHQM5_013027 [Ranunculus cassubicifolius]
MEDTEFEALTLGEGDRNPTPPQSILAGEDDRRSLPPPRHYTQEEWDLFNTPALWLRPIPGLFLPTDKSRKRKINACVSAISNAYMITRRTQGDMSDVLKDDSCREMLLQFALPILILKQYCVSLAARVGELSEKYQTVADHANASDGLLEGRGGSGEGKCIACSLDVSHPMNMRFALEVLSKIDGEILAAGNNGKHEHSARMFNTLLIMKEMLGYFGISYSVSEDKTNKFTTTVSHEKEEIVAAEKLCVSCQRKSEKAILTCESLDTPTDIARLIRTCLLQLKSHIEWQECLFIGLIDSVHGLFTTDSIYAEPRKVYLGGNTFGLLSMRTMEPSLFETALVETTDAPLGVWFATRPK